MGKTRIGLSVGVVSAACYLLFQFGGYTPGLLLVGYVLLCESDAVLKRNALTAVILTLGFAVVNYVLYLLPNSVSLIQSMLNIFGEYVELYIIDRIFNFFGSVLGFVKGLLMVFLAGVCLLNRSVKLPFLNKLISEE